MNFGSTANALAISVRLRSPPESCMPRLLRTGRSVVPFAIGKTRDKARRDILAASLNVGREHFSGVKNRQTAVVCRQDPDYNGVSRYSYGTNVDLWYVDADATDVQKMIREFKVDSTKIEVEEGYEDGRPTPDQIEERDGWAW